MDKQGYKHARAFTLPRTRAHTHIQICNIYRSCRAKMIPERTPILRHTYIVCLLKILITLDSFYKGMRSHYITWCKALLLLLSMIGLIMAWWWKDETSSRFIYLVLCLKVLLNNMCWSETQREWLLKDELKTYRRRVIN